ncbi:MAG: DnaD domain protein [Solobacterium sp.]|nr:DnaD domain protein [Solobacterium sp.]
MELKPKDDYRIEGSSFLSDEKLTALFSLYMPLVGMQAVSLYLTLYTEGLNQKTQESHQRLLTILNLGIDDFERARIRLEEYQLLHVYCEELDNKNRYIYSLLPPLTVDSFFASKELYQQWQQILGQKNAELTLSKLRGNEVSKSGYHDVTRRVKHFKKRDYDTSVVYQKIEPRVQFVDEDTDINFDYERFFATTSTLVFPAELRTPENLKLIGKLATVYGLSVDRMRVLVSRCVKLDTMQFDDEKLKIYVEKSKPDITEAKDPYSLPPVSFLQAKQNGAQVSLTDRKILEDLAVKMHFAPEVINVMIEYILKKSQNRLVRAFVEMVAGEWARDGVKTKEDAIAQTKKKTEHYTNKKEAVLPAYMKAKKTKEKTALTEEEQKAFEGMLKSLEDDNANH